MVKLRREDEFLICNTYVHWGHAAQFAWSVGSHTRLSSQFTTMIKALSNRYKKAEYTSVQSANDTYFLFVHNHSNRIWLAVFQQYVFSPSLTWINLSEIVGPADFKNELFKIGMIKGDRLVM